MSRDTAKGFYDKQPGDPDIRYVTPQRAQAAIDTTYSDLETPLHGSSADNLRHWRDAVDAVITGQPATARILCMGTSITYGWGADNADTDNYPYLLTKMLRQTFPDSAQPVYGPEPLNKFSCEIAGSRSYITVGSGWTVEYSSMIADNGNLLGSAGASPLDYESDYCHGFTVEYVAYGTSTFDVSIDGGPATTWGGENDNAKYTRTITAASPGPHTLSISNITAGYGAVILAVGGAGPVEVANWGVPGSKVENWRKDTGAPWADDNGQWWASLNCVKDYQPDLILMEVGANDTDNVTSLTDFETHLDYLVGWLVARVPATLVLFTTYDSDHQDVAYHAIAQSVAETHGVHWVDTFALMGNNTAQWLGPDLSHFTSDGYGWLATGIARIVKDWSAAP